jgi:hypothetical protein
VAPASRTCEAKMARDFVESMGRSGSLQARRADIEMRAARAIVGDRREFLSIEHRGLAAPADIMPPLRGWFCG